jgi:hypothetical protein
MLQTLLASCTILVNGPHYSLSCQVLLVSAVQDACCDSVISLTINTCLMIFVVESLALKAAVDASSSAHCAWQLSDCNGLQLTALYLVRALCIYVASSLML